MEVSLRGRTQPSELNFFVEGVRCSKCVQKLETLPREHLELNTARFNKTKNLLTLTASDYISPDSAVQWIESKGYKAYFVESSQQTELHRNQAHRRWLTRLAVTFFFASNLMMFAIALYLGAYGPWQNLFGWLCGLLFLPIMFYSAIPFYQSAWQSIKNQQFSADLAIVIAFLWGSFLSYINLVRGQSDFYFDSTASFLFLILFARYLLDRAQNSIESDLNPSLLFKTAPLFETYNGKSIKKVYYHQLKQGDALICYRGQTLPTDLRLSSPHAEIDTSLFSGESLPQTFYRGSTIKAGMVVLSEKLEGQTLGSFEESELNSIFEGVIRNRHEKTKAHAKAEIYSHRLLFTVSILSLTLLFTFGFRGDWAEGFRRALALFTIACPCALALAIPLASVMTLKRAMEQGLFVKSPLFFEKLNALHGIVFDKTGTITQGQLDFHSWDPPQPEEKFLQILLSMEEHSHHPIAQSLTHHLKRQGFVPLALDQWKEIPGVGVEASYQDQTYRIQRISNASHRELTGFELSVEKQILLKAYFKDQIRPEVPGLIGELSKIPLEIYILSGDRKEVVEAIGRDLHLANVNTLSQLSPSDKASFLEESLGRGKHYLMIGDGHNDALALSKAYASLAVKGCAETSLRAADAYAQKSDLQIVFTALDLARFYQRLVHQNVRLSLTYNLIAGSLAIAGMVDPLVAAVLMPINSLVVIGATVLAHPKQTKEP